MYKKYKQYKKEGRFNMSEITSGQTTITVGQKKATDFSREVFDDNETVTLVDTTPTEVQLLRQVLRIKLLGNTVYSMIIYNSMTSKDLEVKDVEEMIIVAKAQLELITGRVSEYDGEVLPNKSILIENLRIASDIVGDIETQLG